MTRHGTLRHLKTHTVIWRQAVSGAIGDIAAGGLVVRRWHSILMRTRVASRELLRKSGKVVLSSDASRFQTDGLVGVLGTYTGEDGFTVTVPSPQVLLTHLGFRVCRFRFLTETQNLL